MKNEPDLFVKSVLFLAGRYSSLNFIFTFSFVLRKGLKELGLKILSL